MWIQKSSTLRSSVCHSGSRSTTHYLAHCVWARERETERERAHVTGLVTHYTAWILSENCVCWCGCIICSHWTFQTLFPQQVSAPRINHAKNHRCVLSSANEILNTASHALYCKATLKTWDVIMMFSSQYIQMQIMSKILSKDLRGFPHLVSVNYWGWWKEGSE